MMRLKDAMIAWIGLFVTTAISLIGALKDLRLVRSFGRLTTKRRRGAWLDANRRPLTVAALTLSAALLAGAGLLQATRSQRAAEDAERRSSAQRDAALAELHTLKSENGQIYENMLTGIDAAPRLRLYIRLADSIPFSRIISDQADANAHTPERVREVSKGYVDGALREALFPDSLVRDTATRFLGPALGFVTLVGGLWKTKLTVYASGFLDPGLLPLDHPLDTVVIARSPGTAFTAIAHYRGAVKAIDIRDGIMRRYTDKEPLAVLGSYQSQLFPHQREQVARRLVDQIREATMIYCLDGEGRWQIYVPLTPDKRIDTTGTVRFLMTAAPKVLRRETGATLDPCKG